MRLIIGISGASGVIYGIRLLEILSQRDEIETHLIISKTAKMNFAIETDWHIKDVESLANVVHHIDDVAASIASGSFITNGMIIAPCSMKTLSAIVNSYADNLMSRAADVVLKEKRRLILMPRETPLHLGHCELFYKAAQLGADVVPPIPAFYSRPQSVADIVDQSVAKVLDLLQIECDHLARWQGRKD